MAAERGDIKRSTSNRALVLYTVFLLVAFGIIGRILYIQYGPDGDELREEAMDKTFARRSILANRGDILSYDDRILATTIPEYDIRMDFNSIKLEPQAFAVQADSLAHCLASFFGDRTADSYYNLLMRCYKDKSRNRYVKILQRKIDYMEQEQVSRFPIFRLGRYSGGYIAEQKSKRFRPAGQLARKVIGGIEQDTIARDGIELSYDKYLRGTSGNRLMQKISGSFWLPVQDPANKEPIDGLDVVSTIDIDIQDIAETALKRQLELGGAKWGTVILMETATGKIRALCNLSRPKAGVYLEDYNYAARRRNEPGSTFKLATLLVLLEYSGMNIRTPVDCTSDGLK
jgi:cell division protein FtsI (penicillin-binding protein 3)